MNECSNVHQLLDVRSINQRIQVLNDRLQQPTGGIDEPRENAFITLDLDSSAIKNIVENAIGQLGQVRTTTTCPGHCILDVAEPNGNLMLFKLQMFYFSISKLPKFDIFLFCIVYYRHDPINRGVLGPISLLGN